MQHYVSLPVLVLKLRACAQLTRISTTGRCALTDPAAGLAFSARLALAVGQQACATPSAMCGWHLWACVRRLVSPIGCTTVLELDLARHHKRGRYSSTLRCDQVMDQQLQLLVSGYHLALESRLAGWRAKVHVAAAGPAQA